jgi:hypothetical protein
VSGNVRPHARTRSEAVSTKGSDTKDDPWELTTPPGTSAYQMWRDEEADPGATGCRSADVPPLLEALGLAELEHNPRNTRMRAA